MLLPPPRIPLEEQEERNVSRKSPHTPLIPGKRRLRHFPEIGEPDGFLEMNLPPQSFD